MGNGNTRIYELPLEAQGDSKSERDDEILQGLLKAPQHQCSRRQAEGLNGLREAPLV